MRAVKTDLSGMTEEQRKQHRREVVKAWAAKNPEKIKAAKLKYRQTNHGELMRKKYMKRQDVREKQKAAKLAWEKENPEMVAMGRARQRLKAMNSKIDQGLRYHYDVTFEQYNEVLEAQGGVCVICQRFEVTSRAPRLVVDHCHETGRIRALLCHRCNCGIGYFKDNADRARRAADYLEAFNEQPGNTNWAGRVRDVLARLSSQDSERGRAEGVETDGGNSPPIGSGVEGFAATLPVGAVDV